MTSQKTSTEFTEPGERAEVISGGEWSNMDLVDLKNALICGSSLTEVADFLCRSVEDVIAKATELGYLARQ
jgi:hypothetical protein